MNSPPTEKRRFVRVSDRLLLAIRTTEDAGTQQKQLEAYGQLNDKDTLPICHQVKAIDDSLSLILHKLGDKMPNTSKAIALLNKKLDLIVHHVLKSEIGDEHQEQEVSISAAGLGFSSSTPYICNDLITLDIMLQPTPYRIITQARVVSCNQATDDASLSTPLYFIRTEFEHLGKENEEVIIQHVIRRQSVILKQQRLMRETHPYDGSDSA